MHEWRWIPVGVLGLLVILQQWRILRARRESRKREEIFQVVTENAADMIALVDVKGRRLYNSPAYKRILGYSPAELGETSAFEQIHADDRFRVLDAAREARESGVGKRLEYRIKHKDGSWKVLESIASTIRDSDGEVEKLVIVNRDITERKRAEEQLEHNLFHDPLTGLPNRRSFLERLKGAFVRGRQESGPYALLLANVDHFKVFNEAMGSASGDLVLTEIARRIANLLRISRSNSRQNSNEQPAELSLFRLGGDEFTILLNPVADASDALRLAKQIQAAVAAPFVVGPQEGRASMTVGIALRAPSHERPEDVLKDADIAMRRAKGLGESRCEVFDEAMHSQAVGRLKLEADLRTALVERQFRVFYQPVVHLETRCINSFEALLRWDHPSQGVISPYRFIDAAEDTGLLVSIGHWLIMQACRQLREWQADDASAGRMNITVNISARQFSDARLVTDIQQALQETGIDPACLQLEMTEAVTSADPRLTVSVLSHLKHMGIGIVLDDFGTGVTSLRALREFPIDVLKLDRSLIREMQTDRSAADIVELIISVAHKMGLKVIAEGVEAGSQIDRLTELGCEFGQGYYFSQPMESKAARQFMRQQVAAMRAAGSS